MIRKALTYLTILAITALPVQLIGASAESVSMQMSMSQTMMANNECLHEMNTQSEIEKLYCDDQSHDCQNCNDCPQAVSVSLSPPFAKIEISLLKATKFSISHSVLNGIPQNKFLRPPKV